MKRLLKKLAPFAPDHSGAVSVLFELGGMITLCDAGGCTGNVCGFDGYVAAYGSHCNTDGGSLQSGSIVYSVANHADVTA